MKKLNEREYERGGSLFRSHTEIPRTGPAFYVVEMFLTVQSKWIPYARVALSARSTRRWRKQALTGEDTRIM